MLIDDLIYILIPATIFALMICIGTELTTADFRRVILYPQAMWLGIIAQLLILPAVSFGIAAFFTDNVALQIGIVLLAACPGGALSNSFVYLAGSRTELSVTLTAVTSILALLVTPLVAYCGVRLFVDLEMDLNLPVFQMVLQIFLLVILPVGIGMTLNLSRPDFIARRRGVIKKAAALLMVGHVFIVIASNIENIKDSIGDMIIPVLLLIFLSFFIGYQLARIFGMDIDTRFTLAIELCLKNVVLAILLATVSLGRPEFSLFALTYGLSVVLIMFPVALLFKKTQKFTNFRGLLGRRYSVES